VSVRIGHANHEAKIMTVTPLISSPLRAEIDAETLEDDERRLQILQMRQLLNSDLEEYANSWSRDTEGERDGTSSIAQAATLIRPQEVRVVQVPQRRRSEDSDADSESSLSLAETLINQSAEQLIRDNVFRQSHGNLAYEVEVLMANARADQERLRNWISSMQGVVERLEQRRRSDARLDASLRLLEHARYDVSASPRRRSMHI
jgi:hypothetical protein